MSHSFRFSDSSHYESPIKTYTYSELNDSNLVYRPSPSSSSSTTSSIATIPTITPITLPTNTELTQPFVSSSTAPTSTTTTTTTTTSQCSPVTLNTENFPNNATYNNSSNRTNDQQEQQQSQSQSQSPKLKNRKSNVVNVSGSFRDQHLCDLNSHYESKKDLRLEPIDRNVLDYSDLCNSAEEILIDNPIHQRGISITGEQVLDTKLLHSNIVLQGSLGVNAELPHSIGIKYNSFPALQHDLYKLKAATPGLSMAGFLFSDKCLEVHYEQSIHKKWQFLASTILTPNSYYLNAYARYNAQNFGCKLMYITDEQMVVFSNLYSVNPKFQVGGEALFSIAQKLPGLSFGCRYIEDEQVLTGTLSPISGHLTSTYTASLRKDISVSTRYEYNLFSAHSDFACGFEITPASPLRMKFRWGITQGVGFIVDFRFSHIEFSMTGQCKIKNPSEPSFGIAIKII